MPTELENLEVLEISIVDEPANERDVLFFKSQGDSNMSNNLEESNFEKTEEFKKLIEEKDLGEEQELKLRASVRTLESLQKDFSEEEYEDIAKSVFGELVEKDDSEGIDASEVAAKLSNKLENASEGQEETQKNEDEGPDKDAIKDVVNRASDIKKSVDEDTWESLDPKLKELAEAVGVDYEISKADDSDALEDVPEEVRDQVKNFLKSKEEENKELRKELEEYRDEIQKERRKKEIQKEKEKAEEKFPLLKGKSEDIAPKLKDLRDHDEELYEDVVNKLKAANDQVEESGFYDEAGTSQEPDTDGDPLEKLKQRADEIKEKSSEDISDEQAFTKATHENPELYNEYRKQKSN